MLGNFSENPIFLAAAPAGILEILTCRSGPGLGFRGGGARGWEIWEGLFGVGGGGGDSDFSGSGPGRRFGNFDVPVPLARPGIGVGAGRPAGAIS